MSSYLIMVLYRTVPLESLSAVVWSVCPLPENSSGSPSCASFQCPEASSERSSLNTCPTKPHGKPCWQCSLEAINIYTESNLKNQHTHTKTYCTVNLIWKLSKNQRNKLYISQVDCATAPSKQTLCIINKRVIISKKT